MFNPPTQLQIFYLEKRKIAEFNLAFLDMVKNGLTRRELRLLIEKRPEKYERFSDWLDVLPEGEKHG
jgi:hypothetical protein